MFWGNALVASLLALGSVWTPKMWNDPNYFLVLFKNLVPPQANRTASTHLGTDCVSLWNAPVWTPAILPKRNSEVSLQNQPTTAQLGWELVVGKVIANRAIIFLLICYPSVCFSITVVAVLLSKSNSSSFCGVYLQWPFNEQQCLPSSASWLFKAEKNVSNLLCVT